MALFPELWNAGHHRSGNPLSRQARAFTAIGSPELNPRGSAPKFYKRTILAGLVSFLWNFDLFTPFSEGLDRFGLE
jgi:hypothetical protein